MTEGRSPSDRSTANERQRMKYAKQASSYDKESDFDERWLYGTEHRTWACSGTTGTTLEVAIGTGLNLPLYPPEVRLVGLDLTPEMLALARSRAADLAMPVTLCEGDAQALPFCDGTFDTVLSTPSRQLIERRVLDRVLARIQWDVDRMESAPAGSAISTSMGVAVRRTLVGVHDHRDDSIVFLADDLQKRARHNRSPKLSRRAASIDRASAVDDA